VGGGEEEQEEEEEEEEEEEGLYLRIGAGEGGGETYLRSETRKHVQTNEGVDSLRHMRD